MCVVVSGCGWRSPAVDDAGPPVTIPSTDGGGETASCFAQWLDRAPAIAAPTRLSISRDDTDDRDAWISPDGRRLYFASTRAGGGDLYVATRADPSADFGAEVAIAPLNSAARESGASLNQGEDTIALASNRDNPEDRFDIYLAVKDSQGRFGEPSKDGLDNINRVGSTRFDPFLAPGGLRLYVAPIPDGSAQRIMVAERSADSEDFGPPVVVDGIGDATTRDADPALAAGERVIVFSSFRGSGTTNLWYAVRSAIDQPFSQPAQIPNVNDVVEDDGDPVLSADGCELFFASRRGPGSDYDLFVAKLSRPPGG